ncbi:hypothetical protein BCPG_03674 [Burkholderia cenocepacia PC184]|nr:hypothetical protein BCPG_03674 [Burkholderia cenocepacia PC184]
MPGGTRDRYRRRSLGVADRARCVRRRAPLRRFPRESRRREQHPVRPAEDAGGRGRIRRRAGVGRHRVSGVRADEKGRRAVSGHRDAAAVGRGQPVRARRAAFGAGRSRHRACDPQARAAARRRPAREGGRHGRQEGRRRGERVTAMSARCVAKGLSTGQTRRSSRHRPAARHSARPTRCRPARAWPCAIRPRRTRAWSGKRGAVWS